MLKLLKLLIVNAAIVTIAIVASQPTAGARTQDLPEREGVALVREKCVVCHEADLIVQQRLSRAGWTREVDKMIRWGTVVTDAQREAIITWLSNTPANAPATRDAAPGRKIFEEKCLVCHEADLSSQQRLARAGWTREVDKMIRWGAEVSETEKPALIDYLVQEYGVAK